jgi:hypothetical protein
LVRQKISCPFCKRRTTATHERGANATTIAKAVEAALERHWKTCPKAPTDAAARRPPP